MPSNGDNSSGSGTFSSPRSMPLDSPGETDHPPTPPAPWLADYLTAGMVAAGIDAGTARQVADDLSPGIVAAFATIARLEFPGVLMR